MADMEGDEHSQEDAIRNDRQHMSVNGARQPLPSRLKSQSGLKKKKEKDKKRKVNDWYTRFSSGLIVLHCWAIFLMMSTDFISRGRGCNMILAQLRTLKCGLAMCCTHTWVLCGYDGLLLENIFHVAIQRPFRRAAGLRAQIVPRVYVCGWEDAGVPACWCTEMNVIEEERPSFVIYKLQPIDDQ